MAKVCTSQIIYAQDYLKYLSNMLKAHHLFFIFIPAIFIAVFALFIQIVQFQPLFEKPPTNNNQTEEQGFQIPIFPEDPIVGNIKSPITLVTFEDLGCEGCKEQNQILNALQEKYPNKIKIIWKPLTVTRFPHSTEIAHQYAYCANKQGKFVEFKEIAFANSNNLSPQTVQSIGQQAELDEKKLTSCLADEKTKAYTENVKQIAKALNIQGVPRIFINNKQIETPQTITEWEILLELK